MLTDETATEELLNHLEARYGVIKELSYINYDPSEIMKRFSVIRSSVKMDEINEFEKKLTKKKGRKSNELSEIIDSENPLFDDLLSLA